MILGQGLRWHTQSGVDSPDPEVKQMMLESILEILNHSESIYRPRTTHGYRGESAELPQPAQVHKFLLVWDGSRDE